MTAPAALRDLARDIAEEAGALAARRRAEGVEIAATKSSLADIVTAADREVEDLIRERLSAERPEDGFYGEESGLADTTAEYTWIVDPIDGTVNYAKGIPHYAVSIAVVTGPLQVGEWTALAGVVHQPATGDTFVAARGEGAFLGDARLHVADITEAGALLATGFGYDPATHEGTLPPSPASCPSLATCAGQVPRRSTSRTWRPGASTATSSAACNPGITPPVPSSSKKPGSGRLRCCRQLRSPPHRRDHPRDLRRRPRRGTRILNAGDARLIRQVFSSG